MLSTPPFPKKQVITVNANYSVTTYNGPMNLTEWEAGNYGNDPGLEATKANGYNPDRTCCDSGQMHKTAEYEMGKIGDDIDSYDHKIFIWPGSADKHGASVAGVAGLKSDWVGLWYTNSETFTHELGHNLGMQHAVFPGVCCSIHHMVRAHSFLYVLF